MTTQKTELKITEYLKPIFLEEGILRTQDGLEFMIPRFIMTNPIYWKRYSGSYIVSIMFSSEEEQLSVLSKIVRSINKAHTPTKEILDEIPRSLIPYSMMNEILVNVPGLITEKMLAGMQEYTAQQLDYILCIYSSPPGGRDEKTYVMAVPLYYDIGAMSMEETNPELVYYLRHEEPTSDDFDPFAPEHKDIRNSLRQFKAKKTCLVCKKDNCNKRCPCGTYYCSKECQKIDWNKDHKKICDTVRITNLAITNMLANTD